MNRRRFLELLGMAAVGSSVVYSFPSIIVPKNIVVPATGWNFTATTNFLASDGSQIITSMWEIPSKYALPIPINDSWLLPVDYSEWRLE